MGQAKQCAWWVLIDSLRVLRGVDYLAAITIMAEIGDLRRFRSAPQYMAYVGLVPSEFSSGGQRRTASITKTGNDVVRRILVESAWIYRFAPRQTHHLQRKAKNASPSCPRARGRHKIVCAPSILPFAEKARTKKPS